MAYLAVNKDGTEIISDYSLYRSGYYKRYKKCDPVLCDWMHGSFFNNRWS